MFHIRLLYISEVFQLSPQWSSTRSYNQILGLYLFKTQDLKNSYGFSWGVICVRNSTLSCEHYLKAPQRFQTGPKDSELTAYLDPTLVLQHTSTSEPQYLLTTSANFSCRIGHNLGHIGWNNRKYHRLQWSHIGFMTAEITDDYIVFSTGSAGQQLPKFCIKVLHYCPFIRGIHWQPVDSTHKQLVGLKGVCFHVLT